MIQRQRSGGFYAYPAQRPWWSRLLWRLGFDPLTTRQRLTQVETELNYWKGLAK